MLLCFDWLSPCAIQPFGALGAARLLTVDRKSTGRLATVFDNRQPKPVVFADS